MSTSGPTNPILDNIVEKFEKFTVAEREIFDRLIDAQDNDDHEAVKKLAEELSSKGTDKHRYNEYVGLIEEFHEYKNSIETQLADEQEKIKTAKANIQYYEGKLDEIVEQHSAEIHHSFASATSRKPSGKAEIDGHSDANQNRNSKKKNNCSIM